MPLQKQTLAIPFAQGLDTATDPKQTPWGRLHVAENVRFGTKGRVEKRYGFEPIPRQSEGVNVSSGIGLGTLDGSLYLATPTQRLVYSHGLWRPVAASRSPSVEVRRIATTTGAQPPLDYAVSEAHGLEMVAGAVGGMFDLETGALIRNGVSLDEAQKLLVLGGYLISLRRSGASLMAYATDLVNPTADIGPATVTTTLAANGLYDACIVDGVIVVAWADSSVSGRVSLRTIAPPLSMSSVLTPAGTTAPSGCVTVFSTIANDGAWLAYATASDVLALAVSIANGVPVSVTRAQFNVASFDDARAITGVAITSTEAMVFAEIPGASAERSTVRYSTITTAGTSTLVGIWWSCGLASKAFRPDGLGPAMVLTTHESVAQSCCLLRSTDQISPLSVLALRVGSGLLDEPFLPEVVSSGPGQFTTVFLDIAQQQPGVMGTTVQRISTVTFDFTAPVSLVEIAHGLHSASGVLAVLDGRDVQPSGHLLYPEPVTAQPDTGTTLAVGQYQYVAVYERYDAHGQLHRSSPSAPATAQVVGVGAASITVVVPDPQATTGNPSQTVLYRTQVNQTIFRRLPITYSSQAQGLLTFVDSTLDTALDSAEVLYTGSELENLAPPAPRLILAHRNRLILVPAESPTSWWYSKEIVDGWPVEWNDALVQSIASEGGPITGGGSLDDKLIIFQRRRIWYVAGEGPAPNGSANDYTQALPIPGDVGCISAESVVAVPDGLLFQAEKGIYLLSRALQLAYVGEPVEAWNGDLVTSAVAVPDSREVRFSLASGVVLSFHYGEGAWSVDTGIGAIAATLYVGRWAWLQPNGTVWLERVGRYADDRGTIAMKAQSAWGSFAGVQGFERVWRAVLLGEYLSPHRLRIEIAHDFEDAIVQTVEIDPAALLATGSGLYQFTFPITNQKCQAIRFTVTELPVVDGAGPGASWSSLALEVGVKGGTRRLPAARSFGA